MPGRLLYSLWLHRPGPIHFIFSAIRGSIMAVATTTTQINYYYTSITIIMTNTELHFGLLHTFILYTRTD